LHIPIDSKITEIKDIPNTISYVIKKRIQIDNFNELPKEKRPTEKLIWEGLSEDIEEWLEKVFDSKKKQPAEIYISRDEIE